MNTDLVSELGRRAALHSALGDPGRLAIVDALALGDASPSRLRDALGMASNLLAHHVGVLAGAGVVRRVRSEGDRRRSYLTLVPGALDDLSPTVAVTAPRIVFVCTENAARSQLAAVMWAGLNAVPAESAGTRPATRIHPGTLAVARRHDIALKPRTPRALDEVVRRGDIVITVCDRAHEELPADQRHTHWSIADPTRPGTAEAFDRAVDELTDRIARFAPAVRAA
ncbi:MAG: helix-turn-helix domain-containing protein [Pseudonocardiales bacterium]|nr:helix-turn-helix domain-containing protein [Pseudonocardiales bacterium]